MHSRIRIGCAAALLALVSFGQAAQAQFTAYNDCVFDPGLVGADNDPGNGTLVHYIGANVTTFGIGNKMADGSSANGGTQYGTNAGEATSGLLVDQGSGIATGVTAALTQNGAVATVNWQPKVAAGPDGDPPPPGESQWTGGYDAAVGTDANTEFAGTADATGTIFYGSLGWWVDLTLSGLDPNKVYTFTTTAIRAKANTDPPETYTDRETLYTLSGADGFTASPSVGVAVVGPTQQFVTGNNFAAGLVAQWSDIDPGADGTVVIRAESAGTAAEPQKAYAFDVFKLEEAVVCGNGIVDPGEACDDGAGNGTTACGCDLTCQFPAAGTDCSDADVCNGDETCDGAGTCQAGTPLVCDDGVSCTIDSCDPILGCQVTPDDTICDDGVACNGAETCDPINDCQAGTPVNCDDGVTCTFDQCSEPTGTCINTPLDPLCNDGLTCNGQEFCDPILDCQAGTPIDCSDGVSCTDDLCAEPAGSCSNPPNDANCDDGAFCTGVETCDAINDCQPGTPVDCNDGVSCTNDSCNEGTDSCDNIPDDVICDDGLTCTGAETCDPINDCQAGTPVDCDDAIACTVDSCNEPAGDCTNTTVDTKCADGDSCTADSCDGVLGCANDPIIGCTPVATTNGWGQAALVLMVMGAGAVVLLMQRRRTV